MSKDIVWLTILRGAVEKAIDKLLSDEVLSTSRRLFDNMKPAIKNSDDAIFGYVFGHVSGVLDMTFANLSRQPTSEDIDEISQSITNRMNEIRSRIYETKTWRNDFDEKRTGFAQYQIHSIIHFSNPGKVFSATRVGPWVRVLISNLRSFLDYGIKD